MGSYHTQVGLERFALVEYARTKERRSRKAIEYKVPTKCIGGGTGGAGGHVPPQKSRRNNRAPPKFDIKFFSNMRKYMSLVYVLQLEMAQKLLKDTVNLTGPYAVPRRVGGRVLLPSKWNSSYGYLCNYSY